MSEELEIQNERHKRLHPHHAGDNE